ncbi:hypothetical protein Clacol_003142 [Clathrus columnatus]|uniref:Uncharacterized protein n=1 Tax=Clathrus columnatus TaxID=1419009 RepID=A0AAV5A5Z7_9AGAM|nr:hypothetical protein Clacol_003142 [Clathrus columnatus]
MRFTFFAAVVATLLVSVAAHPHYTPRIIPVSENLNNGEPREYGVSSVRIWILNPLSREITSYA